jgi:site-specific DNA-methyltransferase (adenine-specific)/modification methylase
MPTFGDCELAWTNISKNSVKKVTIQYNGLLGKEEFRFHATQKPLSLMTWCIQQLPETCQLICDPFMGSGTTGVACVKLGRRFIGIEKEPKYFDICVKRIEKAFDDQALFEEIEKPQVVQEMLI